MVDCEHNLQIPVILQSNIQQMIPEEILTLESLDHSLVVHLDQELYC